MKYIKSYKIFESSVEDPKPIIEYLKDIFLEVEDDGFNVDVFGDLRPDTLTSLYNWSNVFTVTIYKSEFPVANFRDQFLFNPLNESDLFKIKDVLETILTAEGYMKSLDYKLNHIQSNEVDLKYSSVGGYDSSVLNSGRREQSKETFYLKIEFTKE